MSNNEGGLVRNRSLGDWLDLGEKLRPEFREPLLHVLRMEERALGATRENLSRAERMLGNGKRLLDQLRGLRGETEPDSEDRERLNAVIATAEKTQTLIMSHYNRLRSEWEAEAGPLNGFTDPERVERKAGS